LSPYLFGFYDSERDDTRTPFASSAIAGRIESAVWQYQDEPYFFEFRGKKKGAPFLDVGGIFCFFVKFSEKIFCFTEIKKKVRRFFLRTGRDLRHDRLCETARGG
jgi:hypothetical protein